MKNLLFLFITIFSNHVFSQSLTYNIKGKINQDSPYKYAYLHIFASQKTTRTLITHNLFEFEGLKANKDTLITAAIFLGEDSTKTYQDCKLKLFEGINDTRNFVIENADILIDAYNIEASKVIGTELNVAYDDMLLAIKSHNYISYFNKNPNSPVSLIFLLALTGTNRLPSNRQKADISLYYDLISDKLKNDYLGRKVAEIIRKEYKD